MTSCENCGFKLTRDKSVFRDTEVCENCGWWVRIVPATKITIAAVITGFLIGVLEPFLDEPNDTQPA
jgi:hypothetical protein